MKNASSRTIKTHTQGVKDDCDNEDEQKTGGATTPITITMGVVWATMTAVSMNVLPTTARAMETASSRTLKTGKVLKTTATTRANRRRVT